MGGIEPVAWRFVKPLVRRALRAAILSLICLAAALLVFRREEP